MALVDTKTQYQHLSDIFPVKELIETNKVTAGIAVTQEDRIGRLQVVTTRYLDEKTRYITETDLNTHGLYVDEYEDISIPLVAKNGKVVTASFRMVPNSFESSLPIINSPKIKIDPQWQDVVANAPFELTQFAKHPNYHRDPRPPLAVIKAYMGIAENINRMTAVAVIDDAVLASLNGSFSGFNITQIGPSVHYMGSSSTPVFIDINKVRQNSRETGHANLADFLEGKNNIPGFEWYDGP